MYGFGTDRSRPAGTFTRILLGAACLLLNAACQQQERTPSTIFSAAPATETGLYDLPQIQDEGLLVAATLSGPDTYYELRGQGFGLQFLLAEEFASHLGVRLDMEIAPDTASLLKMLEDGDIDLIALPMGQEQLWMTRTETTLLNAELQAWWDPERPASILKRTQKTHVTRRRARPKMADPAHGIISQWDDLFVRYSAVVGWDWRLLAAMSYQESAFDPEAQSWVGARGLMQLMPNTARELGVPEGKITDPEQNIAAAARYLKKLDNTFSDITDRQERISFILASYNGGSRHVRDAMALTRKHGGDDQQWRQVAPWILRLSEPQYYRDPVVKNGYLRGTETEGYVRNIQERWNEYRGSARAMTAGSTPKPAQKSAKNGEFHSQVKSAEEFLAPKDTLGR